MSSAFLSLTKNWKIQNIKQNTTSKPCASFVERRTRTGKQKTYFFHGKTSIKKKNGVQTCNSCVFSTKHSVVPQYKGFNGKFTQRRL